MATESEDYLAVLKASYDYEPHGEDEIAIKEDQLLFLLERTDEDWWKVKIKGESQEEECPVGLVPAAYVEQANHSSHVKALYDYDAAAPGELTVKEDELLLAFDREDDWLLVQSQKDGGKAGFVPANYIEDVNEQAETPASHIVIPPSPTLPVSTYIDPADRVAATKVKADDIKTWPVSEVDKKGKKKKGTLGVGNGAVFFASESDKTPVQKWQTANVLTINIDKSKHIHMEVGGPTPITLHFNAGSKDTAEAIVAKLESSKEISSSGPSPSSPSQNGPARTVPPPLRTDIKVPKKASVHFSAASPVVIPPREPSEDEEENEEVDQEHDVEDQSESAVDAEETEGETATALYDFDADGEDELSVKEGEPLIVLERDGDEWWKVRNETGVEGVVPASYIEVIGTDLREAAATVESEPEIPEEHDAVEQQEQERLRQEQLEERERKEREEASRARAEKERKTLEAERKQKAIAAAAEVERKRRQETPKRSEPPRAGQPSKSSPSRPSESKARSANGESSSSKSSTDKRPPSGRTRVWHDRSGQFRVEAAFLGFNNGKLRLHKINGVVVEVPTEKMSVEDMEYVEEITKGKRSPRASEKRASDDNVPLAVLKPDAPRSSGSTRQPKKIPKIDWFEFFLSAGCDLDDCTRYASSFERDKIDETILLDITDATMRSLGLREGDIIRVTKAISQRKPNGTSASKQEQVARDAEYAKQLQAEESAKAVNPPPNLFAQPDGALKPRRGRPQPSKSLPPPSVAKNAISTASDHIQRTVSPLIAASPTKSSTPVQPPARSSSALPASSGFDDDAWTNRPSSTKPIAPTSPTDNARAPSAPPASAAPPNQHLTSSSSTQPQSTGLAKTTESDIFDQLARLSQLRTKSPPTNNPTPPVTAPPPVGSPPTSYHPALGVSPSPLPTSPLLQNNQPALLPLANAPRGPFAPVPQNQPLLQPLIPTNSMSSNFVPTRAMNATSPFQSQLSPPSFLGQQPTGFPGLSQSPFLNQQATGFPNSQPLLSQPTSVPSGGFGFTSSLQNNPGFVASNPTGFNPGIGPFSGPVSPPSIPTAAPKDTSPANVFAQMKSGSFASANEHANPQPSDKYDALRPNLSAQPTGWGYQGANGFQGGYGYPQ